MAKGTANETKRTALGFRVDPTETAWALVDPGTTSPVLENDDKLVPPKVFAAPQVLVWYADQMALLLKQHAPLIVAVRFAETFVPASRRRADRQRARIEGVLIETAARAGVEVFTGDLKEVATSLGVKAAKPLLDADDLRGLDWKKKDAHRREAILIAVAALGVRP